jgi:predicted O-methyltransferase YrrM
MSEAGLEMPRQHSLSGGTSLRFRLSSAINGLLFPQFFRLKLGTAGLLPARVYREIYLRTRELPDLDIVEVGAGSGSATIAMALALNEAGRQGKIVSVEKCEGGSRLDYGDRVTNLSLLETNLVQFRVRDRVVLYPHHLTLENGPEVVSQIRTGQIAALVHDADGRIDRDFALFFPLLRPGGLVIIDDYENRAAYQPVSARYPDGGTKSLLTFRLLNQLMRWGLVTRRRVVGNTFFGRKPEGADFSRFDADACRRIVADVNATRDRYLQSVRTPRDKKNAWL